MKTLIYIPADERLQREVNFHPLYVYAVCSALEQFPGIRVITADEKTQAELSNYGIPAEKGEAPANGYVALDPSYPAVSAGTWKKVAACLSSGQVPDAPFVHFSGSLVQPDFSLELPEMLNAFVPGHQPLIDAHIRSDFSGIRPVRFTNGYRIVRAGTKGKPALLFSAPYEFFPSELRQRIEDAFDVIYAFNAPYDVTTELIADREAWITGTCPPYKIDAKIIGSAKNLRVMATPSTGTNHIDTEAVQRRNIRLLSIKNSPVIENIHASSEFSFALLMAVVKKIPFAVDAARHGTWREIEDRIRSVELSGKTIGLIGFGRIGKKMARFSNAFGMRVLVFDPFKTAEETHVTQVSDLPSLLSQSDIVSLHYHLTPETENSFTAEQFSLMKEDSYFINTARGELVVEQHLLDALRTGKLRAAGVDVITGEQTLRKWDHPLISYARNHDNLVISPHIAGLTVESECKAMADLLDQVLQIA